MMMLADSNRNVVFGNELMVDDNFDMPLSKEDRDKFMMIMICTKGYMRFRCNLQERVVKAGDVVILFPNSIGECLESSLDFQVAFIACLDDSYAGEASASFSAKFRNRLVSQMIITLTGERMNEMLFLYRLMRKKMEAPHTEFTREALKGCMQVILAECYQALSEELEIKETEKSRDRPKRLLDTFLNLVQRHYTHERSITFYASEMCLTPKYLAQVIYQESGQEREIYRPAGERYAELRQRFFLREIFQGGGGMLTQAISESLMQMIVRQLPDRALKENARFEPFSLSRFFYLRAEMPGDRADERDGKPFGIAEHIAPEECAEALHEKGVHFFLAFMPVDKRA